MQTTCLRLKLSYLPENKKRRKDAQDREIRRHRSLARNPKGWLSVNWEISLLVKKEKKRDDNIFNLENS